MQPEALEFHQDYNPSWQEIRDCVVEGVGPQPSSGSDTVRKGRDDLELFLLYV